MRFGVSMVEEGRSHGRVALNCACRVQQALNFDVDVDVDLLQSPEVLVVKAH